MSKDNPLRGKADAATGAARVRAWLEIREPLERQLEPLGRAAINQLRLGAGDHVLDVGFGIGSTPSTLARFIGPSGKVVGIEYSPPLHTNGPLLTESVELQQARGDLPAVPRVSQSVGC